MSFLPSLINFQDLSISSLRREEIVTYICCKSCGLCTGKYLQDNLVPCPHFTESNYLENYSYESKCVYVLSFPIKGISENFAFFPNMIRNKRIQL